MKCIICGDDVSGEKATVERFFAERAKLSGEYYHCYCGSCDFAFFYPRLSDEECIRYYTGYRNEEFETIRGGIEAGYRDYIASVTSPDYLSRRCENLRNFCPFIPASILDVGGIDGFLGRGAFPSAKISVVEIDDDYPKEKHDLVICAHVLEHVSDPVGFLKKIKPLVCWTLYVEVPIDQRVSRMHEHVSQFSQKSLEALMARAGFTIQKTGRPMGHLAAIALPF